MSTDPYSALVRKHFANPRHNGDLDEGVCVAVAGQDVRLCLALFAVEGTMQKLRFRAQGCPHVIAAAEAFCASYEGRPVRDLQTFAATELMQSLAVPVQKTGRILVLEDAVRSLGQKVSATGHTKTRD